MEHKHRGWTFRSPRNTTNVVDRQVTHKRMAIASWVLPVVALLIVSMTGESSIFIRSQPTYIRDQQTNGDIIAVCTFLVGLGFAIWCLTVGRPHLRRRHRWHAILGLLASALVLGMTILSRNLWRALAGE